MVNNKLISVGVIVIIVLAATYLGNKVLSSTPQSSAQAVSQYQVVDVTADTASQVQSELNQNAASGWRLVATNDASPGGDYLIFGK